VGHPVLFASAGRSPEAQEMPEAIAGVTEKPALCA
jgi:hypothetical protein